MRRGIAHVASVIKWPIVMALLLLSIDSNLNLPATSWGLIDSSLWIIGPTCRCYQSQIQSLQI